MLQTLARFITSPSYSRFSRYGVQLLLIHSLIYSLAINAGTQKQDMQLLKDEAKAFVMTKLSHKSSDDIKISLSKMDKRIKLKACPQALSFDSNHNAQLNYKMRIKVSCEAEKAAWSLHLTATIHVFEPVVILKSRKFRNDVLSVDDLDIAIKDVSQFQRAYFHHTNDLVGYRLKNSINKGMVISPSQVIQPWLIKKDQPITISAKNSVLHIRMAGRSLMNAREGDWIRAKNINSGKIVEGTLNAQGELLVGF